MAEKNEKEKAVNEQIRDFGQVELEHGEDRISMLTIIGEIEGHECLPAATKTTKYEHVLPKLAEVEENKNVDGLLLLLKMCIRDSTEGRTGTDPQDRECPEKGRGKDCGTGR